MNALLTAIVVWLAANFELAPSSEHPRIAMVPAREITFMRYKAFSMEKRREIAALHDDAVGVEMPRQVVAIYDDAVRTIFLPDAWTGSTPAELSVLVHEMVHHLQNRAGSIYACPAAREKVAYRAQEKWLGLFGRSLSSEFDMDLLTLKLATACMH
jgi:hypothetical protein